MHCPVAPKSILWFWGGRRRNVASTHWLSSVLSDSQVYIYTVGMARVLCSTPSPGHRCQLVWREEGKKKVEKLRLQGSSSRYPGPQLTIPPRQPASVRAKDNGKVGQRKGGRSKDQEGHQAAATWEMSPHLCSVIF